MNHWPGNTMCALFNENTLWVCLENGVILENEMPHEILN